MARLLLLEDEEVLRTSLARGLRKLPGVEVAEAATVAEAVKHLDAAPPGLVISDIDLPDRSGIEILGEMGRRGIKAPVIFVTAYLKAYGSQIPRHADVDVREKPIAIDELRRLVLERLDTADARASPFSMVDFVQLACMGRRSADIVQRLPGGGEGRVRILAGEVWTAEDPQGTGVEAFRRLVAQSGAPVECRTLREASSERTIHARWEALLLETAQLSDEAARAEPRFEAPAGAEEDFSLLETAAPPARDRFDEVWEEAVSALLARDLPRALGLFLEAGQIRPGDRKVEANVRRLREMGVAEPGGGTSGGGS